MDEHEIKANVDKLVQADVDDEERAKIAGRLLTNFLINQQRSADALANLNNLIMFSDGYPYIFTRSI